MSAGYFDLAHVMGGTLARNGLRGVVKLVVAGFLPPAALGIVRSVYALFKIVAAVADFGLGHAMITFAASAIGRGDGAERERTLKTVLVLYALSSVAVAVAGILVAPWVAGRMLSDAALTPWVRLAFVAVGGQLLWSFAEGWFAAHQRFDRLGLFLGSMPLVMLLAIVPLALAGRLTTGAAIAIHLLAPLAAVLLWCPALDWGFLRRPLDDAGLARRLVAFGRWVWISRTASTVRGQVNPLLLKSATLSGSVHAGEVSAGLYGFGNDLANEITVVSQSLAAVLLPKASATATGADLRRFVRQAYVNVAVLLVPCLALLPLARPLLRLLGRLLPGFLEYLPALDVFALLYVGALASVLALPIQAALYALRRPQIETWIEVATLPVLVLGAIALIPQHGATGAAVAVLIQRAVSLAVLLVFGLRQLTSA